MDRCKPLSNITELRKNKFKHTGFPLKHLANEFRLLIELSRMELKPKVLNRVDQILGKKIDWQYFLDEVERNYLSGLVYHHITIHNLRIPSEIESVIKKNALVDRDYSELFYPELTEIASEFSNNAFPIVLLKGAALVEKVFGSTLLRRFRDIDLLTYEHCVEEIENSLRRLGYEHRKKDESGNLQVMSRTEVAAPRVGSLHRPVLKKLDDRFNNGGPSIDLHYSNLSLGKYDYTSIIERSDVSSRFGKGLRVPQLGDLVIHSAFHLYRHYRIKRVDSADRIRPGILKYLSDLYASLNVYIIKKNNKWDDLLSRAKQIQALEILTYGLFYLDYTYGSGTVPEEILETLLHQKNIKVPISGNELIPVLSVDELLKSRIPLATRNIETTEWMFEPQKVMDIFRQEFKEWLNEGNSGPAAYCVCVESQLIHNGLPTEEAWRKATIISIDEKQTDPNQFFKTHIADFAKPSHQHLTVKLSTLWNKDSLFLCMKLFSDAINFVSCAFHELGESISVFLKHPLKEDTHRIGMAVGEQNAWVTHSLISDVDPEKVDTLNSELNRRVVNLDTSIRRSHNSIFLDLNLPWKLLDVEPYAGLSMQFDIEVRVLSRTLSHKIALTWAGGPFTNGLYPEFLGTLRLR